MTHLKILFVASLALFVISCSSGGKGDSKKYPALIKGKPKLGLEYDYNQLQLMDSEEVGNMVYKRLRAAQGEEEQDDVDSEEGETMVGGSQAVVPAIFQSMRIVLARPDQDGTRSRLFGRLNRQARGLGRQRFVLRHLTAEAIYGITEADIEPRLKVTYVVILENLMAELKPAAKDNKFLSLLTR